MPPAASSGTPPPPGFWSGTPRVSWVPYGGDAESAAAAIAGATRPGESTAAVLLYPEPADTVRAAGAGISWYGMEGMLGEPGMPEGATAVRPGVWTGDLAERLGLPPEGESAARAYRAYDAAFALGVAVLGAQSHDPEAPAAGASPRLGT